MGEFVLPGMSDEGATGHVVDQMAKSDSWSLPLAEWVGAACVALWQVPVPRLRYVTLQVRLSFDREEVGGRFYFDDEVTAADRDAASEFDGELISHSRHWNSRTLDLPPVSLLRPEVPQVGVDELVIYAGFGEKDPTGRGWQWVDGSYADQPPLIRLRIVTALALRGVVAPSITGVVVHIRGRNAQVNVGWAGSVGPEMGQVDAALERQIMYALPQLESLRIEAVRMSAADCGRVLQDKSWTAAYIAGPPPVE